MDTISAPGLPAITKSKNVESSSFPGMRRQLSKEEEQELEQLREMLMDLLTEAVNNSNGQQRSRIREIENRIAELTGEKPKTNLAAYTKKLPGQEDDQEEQQNPLLGNNAFLDNEKIRRLTLPHMPIPDGPGTLATPLSNATAAYLAAAQDVPKQSPGMPSAATPTLQHPVRQSSDNLFPQSNLHIDRRI